MTLPSLLGQTELGPGIEGLDWGIIVAFLAITTVFAFIVKGRQAGVRDFFLSSRDLPWAVVCASLIATEISAASFVGVPFYAFEHGLTYLQMAIGAILARFLIGYYFIPKLYEQETYSPYQYVGRTLGFGAERMTSVLFMIGAILGQGVRVFIVAQVLHLIAGIPIVYSILGIAAFAALWAMIGGIRTVVWTDLIKLGVLVIAVCAAGIYLVMQTAGGLSAIIDQAKEAGRLAVFDMRMSQVLELTIWTALFGSTFNVLASHGADQMNTQRIFCCRSAGQARKAMLWSSLSQLIVLVLLFVGLGLYAYYGQNESALKQCAMEVGEQKVLPIFIATVMPVGLKGLMVVGLLAAAISSLDSALAALSQTTVRVLYVDVQRPIPDEKSQVHLSRLYTLLWGAVLCLTAVYFRSMESFGDVIGTALKSTSFTYGALLGALLLALTPHKRDGRGLLFSAPVAVLTAVGMSIHEVWAHWLIIAGVAVLFAFWCYVLLKEVEELYTVEDQEKFVRGAWYVLLAEFPRTIWLLAGIGMVLYLHFGEFYRYFTDEGAGEIAWPWYLPVGIGITVVLGYLLSRPLEANLGHSKPGVAR